MKNDTKDIIEESSVVLSLYKERCKSILLKQEGQLTKKDAVDFYISLHIVLEIGINIALRIFAMMRSSSGERELYQKIDKHIEKVSFIDKITMFIYFSNKLSIGAEYRQHLKVVNRLKDFASPRNSFIHGSSVYSVKGRNTPLSERLNTTEMKKQIKLFIDIFNDLKFNFDNLQYQPIKNKGSSFIIEYLFGDLIKEFDK